MALWSVVKELRLAATEDRALAVGGARELAAALRRELARGGDAAAVREGASLEGVAALVYVLAGPVGEDDERALRAADRARVPVVCVVAAPDVEDVPYVLATDVVAVGAGSGFPVDEIARVLAHKLGEQGTAVAARLPVLRPAVCAELIRRASRHNGLIGAAVFVPGVDLPMLTLNQLRLVLRIAAAYGQEIDRQRLPEIVGVLGGAFGFRMLARELLDFVPVAGWALKGAVAYAGTRALGEAAVRYFDARSRGVP
jgi:uncharacterized protein (DUF697 family)